MLFFFFVVIIYLGNQVPVCTDHMLTELIRSSYLHLLCTSHSVLTALPKRPHKPVKDATSATLCTGSAFN